MHTVRPSFTEVILCSIPINLEAQIDNLYYLVLFVLWCGYGIDVLQGLTVIEGLVHRVLVLWYSRISKTRCLGRDSYITEGMKEFLEYPASSQRRVNIEDVSLDPLFILCFHDSSHALLPQPWGDAGKGHPSHRACSVDLESTKQWAKHLFWISSEPEPTRGFKPSTQGNLGNSPPGDKYMPHIWNHPRIHRRYQQA